MDLPTLVSEPQRASSMRSQRIDAGRTRPPRSRAATEDASGGLSRSPDAGDRDLRSLKPTLGSEPLGRFRRAVDDRSATLLRTFERVRARGSLDCETASTLADRATLLARAEPLATSARLDDVRRTALRALGETRRAELDEFRAWSASDASDEEAERRARSAEAAFAERPSFATWSERARALRASERPSTSDARLGEIAVLTDPTTAATRDAFERMLAAERATSASAHDMPPGVDEGNGRTRWTALAPAFAAAGRVGYVLDFARARAAIVAVEDPSDDALRALVGSADSAARNLVVCMPTSSAPATRRARAALDPKPSSPELYVVGENARLDDLLAALHHNAGPRLD